MIKPKNMIQHQFHSKTDSTMKPKNRFQLTSITVKQIQPLNTQIGFSVNSIQRLLQLLNPQI